MTDKPTPGSEEAIANGCTCPVMDNGRGVGFLIDGERQFWISGDCPLHGSPALHHEETR